MNDATTLVLLALAAAGPQHGYAIQQEIERSAGTRLGPGTLYGAIARLEDAHMIEALRSDDRRRPYRITKVGRAELASRLKDMRTLAAWGKAVGAL